MKPYLEKAVVTDDASFSMLHVSREPIAFEWHHHPEYELTLTTNSVGHRFIGDHVGTYEDGDLVIVGPNVPHTWVSTGKVDDAIGHQVRVIKLRPEWVGDLTGVLTELWPIRALLGRAERGLQFSAATARQVRPAIEGIFARDPASRVLELISILVTLAADAAAEPLMAPHRTALPLPDAGGSRIDKVLDHVHAHYHGELKVQQLADIAALSTSAFHRMFRRQTRSTLIEYVIRLRIGEACAQLIATDRPIAAIAESVGYHSLANFGRQFKALKGQTPREYRNRFHQKDS